MREPNSNRENLNFGQGKSSITALLCFLAISTLASFCAGCAGLVSSKSVGGGDQTFSLSGQVTPIAAGSGATVTLSGAANSSTTADSSGKYSFSGLSNGSYVVKPTHQGYSFSPASQSVTINGASQTLSSFLGSSETYSISGNVSGVGGVTVTLSGATNATTMVDVSGNYTFASLANGNYTVTPSKSGYSFSPANKVVSINNGNVTGVSFTASVQVQSYSLSGTLTGVAGATVTLSGVASATTTADGSGNFSFTGLGNGSYTVTPSKTGYSFTPANRAVTISSANVTGVSFTATAVTYSISGTITGGSGATVTLSGAASATATADGSGNFSFNGVANGSYTITPSVPGFTFSPVSQSFTVNNANVTGVAFTSTALTYSISGTITGGSGATVALSGAASATTTADGSGNFSFTGLGNGSYTVTPSKTGYTFTPTNKAVTISNANVTGVNFTAAVLTYSISGTITGGNGATVTLSGATSATTTASGSGTFSFTGLANGAYTITPSKAGYTFSPTSQAVTVSNANVSGVTFTATALTYSISGTISGVGGATVTLSGQSSGATTADGSGNFSFSGLINGSYAITATLTGYTFTPAIQAVIVNGANVTGVSFTAAVAATTYAISGTISPASVGSGATVTLSGAASASTTADSSGNFSFTSLSNGTYTVTPTSTTATFSPVSQSATISNANAVVSFTATASANVIFYDDFTGTALSSEWVALNRAGDYSNGELQCYQPGNAQVTGGTLVETFESQSISCGDEDHSPSNWNYTSAYVQWSSFNFTYGTVEVRAKIPNTSLWPAIWMLGHNCEVSNPLSADNVGACAWPLSGSDEIDIAEFAPNDATARENSYSNSSTANSSTNSFSCGSGPQVGGDGNYHIFTFTWKSDSLSWAVDGQTNCTTTNSRYIPTQAMFLIMNIAANNSATPKGLPQSMYIDYVKVTQP